MIAKVSDYIISPLAMGTHANYECIKAGKGHLYRYVGKWDLPEPFVASIMDDQVLSFACIEERIPENYTRFERMAILAAIRALRSTGIKPDCSRVLFIIASTKGNVELMGRVEEFCEASFERLSLTGSAKLISGWFHNPNEPLVVCNACISGISAQLEAVRALESGDYDYAVVIGVDVLSPFIVSGFQSLKALSDSPCQPFDEERFGLNLGEASACIVYACADTVKEYSDTWFLVDAVVRNDAYHTSSPSKTAEGAYRALKEVFERNTLSEPAFINVHGTATLFNDEMEATAINRMGLNSIPINGLKGSLGHTLGASGVIETLISMEAINDHTILATNGFRNLGVSCKINISNQHRQTDGNTFLKMMAGFGGCNAVAFFRKGMKRMDKAHGEPYTSFKVTHILRMTSHSVVVNDKDVPVSTNGMSMLKELYCTYIKDYPKFYKMDPLCKVGFIASELLLDAESEADNVTRFFARDDRALVWVTRTASFCADKVYQRTIQCKDDYYPSPSAFIYTLPNVLTGEIAIRNHYHGETICLLQNTQENVLNLMSQAFSDVHTRSVVGGWIEVESEDCFEVVLYIIKQ